MDALIVKDFQSKGTKYLTFSNRDGKKWSIPMKNMQMALELYEPSGIKGKILKKLLPIAARVGIAKKILHGSYTSVEMNESVKKILVKCFGDDWEYSVFWGTPCVDQKITIQIYKKQQILGYCKIGNSERVKELFQHEKQVLDLLHQRKMPHVSKCLELEQVLDTSWMFVQSTEKVYGSNTEHRFGKKHNQFIDKLWNKTKETKQYEETDYYESLMFLEEHLDLIDEKYRTSIKEALNLVKECYSGKEIEWGVVHRDFTPWNTCLVNDELFVFDFEYALFNAPKEMDYWHYFIQSKHFEEGCNMREIAEVYLNCCDENDDILFQSYLLDIISLYLSRGEQADMDIVLQRSELMSIIREKRNTMK